MFISIYDSAMVVPFYYNLLDLGCIDTSMALSPHRINQIANTVRARRMDEFFQANEAMALGDRHFYFDT
jgi:hypothetical protein